MAGIRLEFAQFGHFDSFDIIRSMTSMVGVADVDLPTPIATSIKTMYYVDANVVKGVTYYYKVRVWRGTASFLSSEIKVLAAVFAVKSDFISDLSEETGKVWTPRNGAAITTSVLNLVASLKQSVQMPYSSDFHFINSEDVTMRGKFKVGTISSDRRVLFTTRRDSPTWANNWCVYVTPDQGVRFFVWSGTGGVIVDKIWSGAFNFNQEFELSLERKDMTWRLYINSTQFGDAVTQSGNYIPATNSKLTIGSEVDYDGGVSNDSSRDLDGTVRYFQIINGISIGNGNTNTSRI